MGGEYAPEISLDGFVEETSESVELAKSLMEA